MTPRATTRRGLIVGAALLLLRAAPARAESIRITIDDLTFSPARVSARVGDIIEWVNTDFVAHTTTARDGSWNVTIEPGGRARTRLRKPGEVDYYCRFHPNMKGHIDVKDR